MTGRAAERRRTAILNAAIRVIRRDGIGALTTKNVSIEAGCAEGTLFRHFGDKGGLIAAVLEYGLDETRRLSVLAHPPGDTDFRGGLVALIEGLIDFYRVSYPIVASALVERAVFERYSAAHRAAGTGPQQSWIHVHQYLQDARDRGVVAADLDLEVEALFFAGACQNAVWVELVSGSDALPHGGRDLASRLVDSRMPTLAPQEVCNPA